MPPIGKDEPVRILTPERILEIETFIKNLPEGTTKGGETVALLGRFGPDVSLYLNQTNPDIINRVPAAQVGRRETSDYLVGLPTPRVPPVRHFNEVEQGPEIRPDPENPGQFITVERE